MSQKKKSFLEIRSNFYSNRLDRLRIFPADIIHKSDANIPEIKIPALTGGTKRLVRPRFKKFLTSNKYQRYWVGVKKVPSFTTTWKLISLSMVDK